MTSPAARTAALLLAIASLAPPGHGASNPEPPFPDFRETFSYVPTRDGLALLGGGPSQDGYAASARANPNQLWEPRFSTEQRAKGTDNIFNGEFQFYPDPEYPWSNGFTPFSVADGDLRIRAERSAAARFAPGEIPADPATKQPYPWVSGILVSRQSFSQHGGYFEIEAKMPRGTGTWPAFWLVPVDEQHPPEIDVVEYRGHLPREYHVAVLSPPRHNDEGSYAAGRDLSENFHRYGILWADNRIEFYLDRRLTLTKDISRKPEFAQPFYMVVNLAMGSRGLKGFVPSPGDDTPSPVDFVIRSITVWQREGPTGVVASSTSVPEDLPPGSAVADLSITRFGDGAGERFSVAEDPDGMFEISGAQLLSRAAFDFARKQSHLIVVRAADSQGRVWQQPLVINVLDAGRGRNLYRADAPGAGEWAIENAWSRRNVAILAGPGDAEFIREKPTRSPAEFSISQLAGAASAPGRYVVRGDFKPVGRRWIKAEITDADYSSNLQVYFDLEAGKLGRYYLDPPGGDRPRFVVNKPVIAPVGDGFYRCQIDFTSMAAGALRTSWRIAASGEEPSPGHVGDAAFANGTPRRGRGVLFKDLRFLAP